VAESSRDSRTLPYRAGLIRDLKGKFLLGFLFMGKFVFIIVN